MRITEPPFLLSLCEGMWLILSLALFDRRSFSRFQSVAQTSAGIAVLVGGVVFIGGWMLHLSFLKSVLPDAATMKVNTTLGFVLSGVALSFLSQKETNQTRRGIGRACAAIVCLIGFLTLTQYLFGWDFHIDQLLIKDLPGDGTAHPGRMAPVTALNFMLIGFALLLLHEQRRFWLPQILAILTALISLTALVGYLYGVSLLYEWSLNFRSIALHTALTFFILSVGILYVFPRRGIMAVVTNDTPGGLMARRLFPAAVIVLLVLGWLRLQGERAGFYDTTFGLALMVLSSIVIIGSMILWNARLLYEVDTRRQKSEEVLRASEERYRRLVENFPNSIVSTLDRDLRVTFIAGRGMEALDLLPADFVGKRIAESLSPELVSATEPHLRAAFDGKVTSFEITYAPGVIFQVTAGPLHDTDGTIHQIITSSLNISESKQAQEALRDSEARLRLSVQSAKVGLWDWDLTTNEVYFSPEWKSQLGYQDDELPNRFEEWRDRLHPDDLAPTLGKVQSFIEPPAADYTVEFRMRHKDGSWRWIFTQAQVLRNAAGKPARMLGCHLDITERKLAEQALHERSFLLSESQRIGHIGTWSLELPENRVRWSDETYHIFRVPPQTFVLTPESFLNLIHPDDRASMEAWVAACEAGEKPGELEFRIIPPDGRIRILSGRGEFLAATDTIPARMIGTVQDITERRLAQQQIKTSNEQLRALSARLQVVREAEGTRIAREIHDELGGALTGLKWDLERIERILSEPDNEAARFAVQEKLGAMMGMIGATIVTMRRISSELRPGVLDDLGLVSAVEWQAQQFQERTGIACVCDSGSEEVSLSREPSTAVFRIFQEILTNILRHARASRVRIRMVEESGYFILAVSDNGRGITESEKSSPRSLGLLGMQERAHLVGGEVEIVREGSQGTTVTVRVPLSHMDEEGSADEM